MTRRPRKRVLVVKTGDAASSIRTRIGDYDRWFAPALATIGTGNSVQVEVIPAHQGIPVAGREADAVVVCGSPQSLTEPSEWMRRLAGQTQAWVAAGVPFLGVCFGHQLLAYALGSSVQRNPRGREIGTVDVTLTVAGMRDPLFRACPPRFAVQATHEDVPAQLPDGAVALAENGFGLQAMAVGKSARGVQFHPELPPEGMRAVIEARAPALEREGLAMGLLPGERSRSLLAGVRPSPVAARVLRNFFIFLS